MVAISRYELSFRSEHALKAMGILDNADLHKAHRDGSLFKSLLKFGAHKKNISEIAERFDLMDESYKSFIKHIDEKNKELFLKKSIKYLEDNGYTVTKNE